MNKVPIVKQTESTSSTLNLASNIVNKSKLFHHFDQYKRDYSIVEKYSIDNPKVHPAFIKLGINIINLQFSRSELILLFIFKKRYSICT